MNHSQEPEKSNFSAKKRAVLISKFYRSPSFVVLCILIACCIGYAAYWHLSAQYSESTEDAYVDGNVVLVTPQTTGTVTTINADNTDYVQAGALLLTLNSVDAQLALQQAEAQLAKTVRQVRGQFSSASQMQSNINIRRAELSRAESDLSRRTPLVKTGAISAESFHHAEEAVKVASASLAASEQQFASNKAMVENTSIESHPDVLASVMKYKDAYLAVARNELRAPVSGMVTKRSAQVGQRVSPGTPLMSVVPLNNLWVTANFKESQLRDIRDGQSVKLIADVYGSAVEYQGKVEGLDAGTGSAFSLLPAQNATGNWIKVVQRVPVRITIDEKQLAKHPLRIGLSMKIKVDTQERNGQSLALMSAKEKQNYETDIFNNEMKGVEQKVHAIIAANLSGGPRKLEKARK